MTRQHLQIQLNPKILRFPESISNRMIPTIHQSMQSFAMFSAEATPAEV